MVKVLVTAGLAGVTGLGLKVTVLPPGSPVVLRVTGSAAIDASPSLGF